MLLDTVARSTDIFLALNRTMPFQALEHHSRQLMARHEVFKAGVAGIGQHVWDANDGLRQVRQAYERATEHFLQQIAAKKSIIIVVATAKVTLADASDALIARLPYDKTLIQQI